MSRETFEIGRFLHRKSEIRDRKLDCRGMGSDLTFRISDLRRRNRSIPNLFNAFHPLQYRSCHRVVGRVRRKYQ